MAGKQGSRARLQGASLWMGIASVYMYIYIERERERERDMRKNLY